LNKLLAVWPLPPPRPLPPHAPKTATAYRSKTAKRIDFSLHGNDRCVIIDDKIRCQPARMAPARMAASDTR